jgi:hypothetical protein
MASRLWELSRATGLGRANIITGTAALTFTTIPTSDFCARRPGTRLGDRRVRKRDEEGRCRRSSAAGRPRRRLLRERGGHGAERRRDVLDHFIDQGVEGIIVIAPEAATSLVAPSFATDVPVVLVAAGAEPAPGVQIAAVDQQLGARLATRHLVELGVPGDVSIVGFDDIPGVSHLIPSLTTVRQDLDTLGHRCIDMLLAVLNQSPVDFPLVEPVLVVRDSSRANCDAPATRTP